VTWEHFGYAVDGGIATLRFDRPERLNALTFEVYEDLSRLLGELPRDGRVQVLVITGAGRGFCSGGDVHEIIGRLVEMEARELLAFTRLTGSVVQRLREAPVPVVAGVNGVAAGAGAVIALASDFRVLARSASFQFLFTHVGLSGADMGIAWLLPRMVGLARATELLMLGDKVDADAAARLGIANEVVDDDELDAATQRLALRLARGPTLAYAATKSLLAREAETSLSAAVEMEALVQALLMTTRDHAEFHKAFTERREPKWEGR
jgi:enoyl-CoA hydratase/carnithine racemase